MIKQGATAEAAVDAWRGRLTAWPRIRQCSCCRSSFAEKQLKKWYINYKFIYSQGWDIRFLNNKFFSASWASRYVRRTSATLLQLASVLMLHSLALFWHVHLLVLRGVIPMTGIPVMLFLRQVDEPDYVSVLQTFSHIAYITSSQLKNFSFSEKKYICLLLTFP